MTRRREFSPSGGSYQGPVGVDIRHTGSGIRCYRKVELREPPVAPGSPSRPRTFGRKTRTGHRVIGRSVRLWVGGGASTSLRPFFICYRPAFSGPWSKTSLISDPSPTHDRPRAPHVRGSRLCKTFHSSGRDCVGKMGSRVLWRPPAGTTLREGRVTPLTTSHDPCRRTIWSL